MSGYGSGFREPRAKGRVTRFKQYLREPISKADVWIAFFAAPISILIILLLMVYYAKSH